MNENTLAANLMAKRGNRCTAAILSYLEDQLYTQVEVPEQLQRQVRQTVLDQVNTFKDLAIDVVKSDTAIILSTRSNSRFSQAYVASTPSPSAMMARAFSLLPEFK